VVSIYRKWKEVRILVLERDSFTCQYCGRKATVVDHVIPRSHGGNEADENLVASCVTCNAWAGAQLFGSFDEKKKTIQKYWADGGSPNRRRVLRYKPQGDLPTLLEMIGASTSVKDLSVIGIHLANIIHRDKPYKFKYLNAVANGSIIPGSELARSIDLAILKQEKVTERHLELGLKSRTVQGWHPDDDGAMIPPHQSKFCVRCNEKFIPNVSRRRRCYICSPPAHRRK